MEDVNEWIPPINYTKSIALQRLIYNRKGGFLFEFIMMRILTLTIPATLLFMAFDQYREGTFISPFAVIFLFAAVIVNIYLAGHLIKIQGISILKNKEDAINTLKLFYPSITFNASEENVLRDLKLSTFSSSGRCITVLFVDDVVYFNKITLGRGSAMICLFSIFDYYKCRQIVAYFKRLQSESAA